MLWPVTLSVPGLHNQQRGVSYLLPLDKATLRIAGDQRRQRLQFRFAQSWL